MLLLLGAASTMLAACIPVTPAPPPYQSSYCQGTTVPVDAQHYQSLHDGLRKVNADFAAADLGLPIDLGDGRTIWLYGDTFVGYVLPDDTIVQPHGFVRNSF